MLRGEDECCTLRGAGHSCSAGEDGGVAGPDGRLADPATHSVVMTAMQLSDCQPRKTEGEQRLLYDVAVLCIVGTLREHDREVEHHIALSAVLPEP
ncbi:Hypothetical predicted protein [Pelobates cultripes]|uniref:Uncharacterized protein n=1 Tax=Pelobates cultripes TaxID=61616 RepID=A0AAD1T8D5_PELCU|nr:Hypothetical predicted protein [Pelobates cultripes]